MWPFKKKHTYKVVYKTTFASEELMTYLEAISMAKAVEKLRKKNFPFHINILSIVEVGAK